MKEMITSGPSDSSVGDKVETEEEFIERCFTYKECLLFCPVITEGSATFKCGCGELEIHHLEQENETYPDEWTPHLIKNLGPTNAYGTLDFYRKVDPLNKSAQYVRISDIDKPKDVIELMFKHWKILDGLAPKLFISILGGLDSVEPGSVRSENFQNSLLACMQTNNVVLTTYGLNAGIARIIGTSISKNSLDTKRIACVGLSPWGYVRSHYNLVRSVHSEEKKTVEYGTSDVAKIDEPISLNEDHTHFILLDNGMRNKYYLSDTSYYRDEVECLIAKPIADGGCKLPVVTLVIGGGYDVLESVAKRAQNGMPVIICSVTGGAADIIQRAHEFKTGGQSSTLFSSHQTNELVMMLEQLLTSCGDDCKPNWSAQYALDLLESLQRNQKCIKCINLYDQYGHKHLKEAILSTLRTPSNANNNQKVTLKKKKLCSIS